MEGVGACTISGGGLTLGTAPGAEESGGKRGGMAGFGACAISGGGLTLARAVSTEHCGPGSLYLRAWTEECSLKAPLVGEKHSNFVRHHCTSGINELFCCRWD